MFRKIALCMGITLAAGLFVTQVVIPHSRKPQLRADAEARLARLEKGREVVLRGCEAAGGLEAWQARRDVSFRLSDQWHVPMSVWPEAKINARAFFLLHRGAGRIELQTKKGSHQWGVYAHRPWALLNGKMDSDGIKRADYTLTSFNYFFELPFKFLDDGAYAEFVGEEMQDGKLYDKVYVSFGLSVGTYPTDWFLAYFDNETGRLASLVYTTIRKSPSFVEYHASFDGYQKIDGLIIPTSVEIKMSRPVAGIKIRNWQIKDVRFDVGLGEGFFQLPASSASSAAMSMQ